MQITMYIYHKYVIDVHNYLIADDAVLRNGIIIKCVDYTYVD